MGAVGAVIFLPREANGSSPMLEDILFSPAALWLAENLQSAGVTRFFVVCHPDDRDRAAACVPEETVLVTGGGGDGPGALSAFLTGVERVLIVTRAVFLTRRSAVRLTAPEPWPAGPGVGIRRMDGAALKGLLDGGAALDEALRGSEEYPRGLDGCCELEDWPGVERLARQEGVERLAVAGVRILDPDSVYIDPAVQVGAGTVLLPGTILRGRTVVGRGCTLGPNAMVRDCTLGSGVTVNASQINESTVEDGATVGPFAYIRPHCHVGRDVKVGDFVELKNSVVGPGTKISHLTYVGDADVGGGVNFGCGTVTVNYDGAHKFRTVIGDGAFIGCNTNLVAPVQVGERAYTAAGSTITDDVPADSLAIARCQQTIKKQWAVKRAKRGK